MAQINTDGQGTRYPTECTERTEVSCCGRMQWQLGWCSSCLVGAVETTAPPGGVRGYGKMPYPPIRVQNYTNLCDFHKKRNVLRTFFVILSPHPNNFIVNDTVLTLSLDADDDHGVA